jgi:hypothetical protein
MDLHVLITYFFNFFLKLSEEETVCMTLDQVEIKTNKLRVISLENMQLKLTKIILRHCSLYLT